jgi:hypothetical protein
LISEVCHTHLFGFAQFYQATIREMGPSSHETSSGAGNRESHETNASMYSTRFSKRKASVISTSEPSSSDTPLTTENTQKTTEGVELMPPPAKKPRSSSTSTQDSALQEPIDPIDQNPPEILVVKVDSPSGSGEDDISPSPIPDRPIRGGHGRGRGRGRGRGGRGARGGSGLTSRGTPAVEFVPSIVKGGRGRGGHRVKKSDNARIQALYHRKHALKLQYRQVALLQRDALKELSQKSLKRLNEDPNYHTSLPEFFEATKAIDEKYAEVMQKIEAERLIKEDYLKRKLERSARITCEQHLVSVPSPMPLNISNWFQERMAELVEIYENKVKQRALHILRQAETGKSPDEVPFYYDVSRNYKFTSQANIM